MSVIAFKNKTLKVQLHVDYNFLYGSRKESPQKKVPMEIIPPEKNPREKYPGKMPLHEKVPRNNAPLSGLFPSFSSL